MEIFTTNRYVRKNLISFISDYLQLKYFMWINRIVNNHSEAISLILGVFQKTLVNTVEFIGNLRKLGKFINTGKNCSAKKKNFFFYSAVQHSDYWKKNEKNWSIIGTKDQNCYQIFYCSDYPTKDMFRLANSQYSLLNLHE